MKAVVFSILFLLSSTWAQAQVDKKIDFYSAKFLGVKYEDGPLGEGLRPDADPLIRFDAFDCTTYVETVMALSRAKNPNDVKGELTEVMNKIRYANGTPKFEERNHFASLDWIPENISKGFIRDVTQEISSDFEVLTTPINKGKWMLLKKQKDPDGFADVVIPADRAVPTDLRVLSLKELLQKNEQGYFLEPRILPRIKTGMIVNVVPVKRDLTALIGTQIDITHQAFLIWKSGVLYIRHASVGTLFVSEKPLLEYLVGRKDTVEYLNFLEVL